MNSHRRHDGGARACANWQLQKIHYADNWLRRAARVLLVYPEIKLAKKAGHYNNLRVIKENKQSDRDNR